ncbi:hypothetical protein KXX57_008818 [Aspergillus fumigatus]|nr:hypothetical protein KXX57_008818 [Aspergillus fumigatus]KAH2670755.1 hypothetical protein KXV32_002882 [Aspergillus fumigatus]KAH2923571.1 hypothetical protein KXW25_006435 [Aspergillus fumigatus]KAH3026992.1 hypothetical protein KXW60_007053 [Aspergillus fumigatus]KAH3205359.1 hypothetical protein KXW62_004910 [Aspergillus fumigatus]
MDDMRNWYASLSSQVLDLVSDYAGQELFCLEGDSVVLQCLDDTTLDFKAGFQLLQGVYNVERLLSRFLSTKCNFHIVFFDENQGISTQAASNIDRSKYQLAREIIYQHLKVHIQDQYPDLQVHRFPSMRSPEFHQHVQTYSVYFVMCHNGVLQNRRRLIDDTLRVICNMMTLGLDVAIINEIEWRDTKILTRVIQASSSKRTFIELEAEHKTQMPPYLSICTQVLRSIAEASGHQATSTMTSREALTVAVASVLLAQNQNEASKKIIAILLLHLACLKRLSLQQRRTASLEIPNEGMYNNFVRKFSRAATIMLQTNEWKGLNINKSWGDLHDLFDGRLFRSCAAYYSVEKVAHLSSLITDDWHTVWTCLNHIEELGGPEVFFSQNFPYTATLQHEGRIFDDEHEDNQDDEEDEGDEEGDEEDEDDETDGDEATNEEDEDMESKYALLPFENLTFDQHLASVRVVIEDSQGEYPERGFEDKTHWHTRRLLDSKHRTFPQKSTTKWNNPARRNQQRLRDFTKYAASLTNAKGNVLEQQVMVSLKVTKKQPKAAKLSSKAKQLIEKQEVERAKKEESSWIDTWQRKLLELQKLDLHHQVEDVKVFLDRQETRKRSFLEPEVRLYLLTLLVSLWQKETSLQEEDKLIASARDVWDQIRTLRHKVNFMTHEMYSMFHDICCKLSIHDTPLPSFSLPSRRLCFHFDIRCIKPRQLGAPLDFQAFQLLHCGPFMDRQTGAKPDDRVGFEPDKWQKDVLDELDKNHSVFVVAPTSAGKTFISFYAMSKVLQEDDTGVLVYVAPTKALVNQIGAEIHARFRKRYSGPEQTVWAIATRDVRINDPLKCQILVTVPHFLQIMLLSSANATTWAPRVKCIIFDEIHSIGHTDDGLVWEQLLLLAPCRIIALSATVGNPSEFADWLQSTQNNMSVTLKLIQHTQRYSDLRKYVYMPADRPFDGLSRPRHKGLLEPKFIPGLHPLHPITSLLSKQRQIPEDLSLEPRDCYTLWRCMVKYSSVDFPVPESLSPQLALPRFIRRIDVYEWEAQLKGLLSAWMQDSYSPFEMVQSDLEAIFAPAQGLQVSEYNEENQSGLVVPKRRDMKNELCTSVFPLLVGLHSQNALPALLFNYARTTCEKIAITTLEILVKAEDKYKSGASWRQKMADYEKYRKLATNKAHTNEKSKKKGNPKQPREETERTAKDVEEDNSPFKRFDPGRPLEQFSFADTQKFDWKDLLEEIEIMKGRKVKPLLLEALKRGVGVHHAGLNRHYRQCVERLFRAGFLRVVVATGTLALGINMPCSTVVFCGDSVFLTALNFRQAAGRAGRRGFDLLGNVIFHGIPRHKVYQLMSSRLPDLNGHFPITTSLVLRLFILLHNSKDSPYAARAINSLLSQPRINFGSAESKDRVLHHLRFSIEYLRRQGLIGRHGEPIRLASSIAHLYYTENSAFAFHALLRAGYFEELCKQHRKNTEKKLRTLMIVLAHLFGRKSLGYRYKELLTRRHELKSPSVVILPPLPPNAVSAIRAHNQSILKTYTVYVETFVKQHLKEPECELPLSKVPVGGSGHQQLSRLLGVLEANQSRSAFVGLSGHGDNFKNMKDLCNSVRSGVFLEESVIPYLDVYPDGGMAPLNAYLYDFFCHGCVEPLEVANFISRSETWFLLNDFSLILATIIVSLQVYLDPDLKSACSEDMFISDDSSSSISVEDEKEELFDVQSVGRKGTSKRTDNEAPQMRKSLGTTRATTDEDVLEKWDEGLSDDSNSSSNDEDTIETQGILPENRPSLVSFEVLNAFRELKDQFDEKFHAIFA